MIAGKTNVLVHVECDHMSKAQRAVLEKLYEPLVNRHRRGAGWQAKDERRLRGCGSEFVDPISDIDGGIVSRLRRAVSNDYTHGTSPTMHPPNRVHADYCGRVVTIVVSGRGTTTEAATRKRCRMQSTVGDAAGAQEVGVTTKSLAGRNKDGVFAQEEARKTFNTL